MVATDWRFKDGYRPRGNVPPAEVGAVIRSLRDAGNLTASAYINEAEPEDAAIHGSLTWDDSEAATEFRLIEARRIIRSTVEVEIKEPSDGQGERTITVIENVHVPDRAGRGEGRYVSSEDIASDADDYAAALAETRARFTSAWSVFRRLQRVSEGRPHPSPVLSIAAEGFVTVDKALGMLA